MYQQKKNTRKGSDLSILETEDAILYTKRTFEDNLSHALDLYRVSAPLFVSSNSGIQDNLNGFEKPVSFTVKETGEQTYEIVHSLAKWKRLALAEYEIETGKGIWTDMNALRPDEENIRTCIHSIYVDQWDWEKVIPPEHRNLDFLKEIVRTIYTAIKKTEKAVCEKYNLIPLLPEDIHFAHTEDLYLRYPGSSRKEREDAICKEKKAVFLIGIGGPLPDGSIHDGRAPDYDDWITPTSEGKKGLNGDIIVWNPIIHQSFELSSMGIRVNKETLVQQLEIRNSSERLHYPWHTMLMQDRLPQSVGGGIGQSRLSMLLLQKQHIGEVQVSVWPQDVIEECKSEGIRLL